jgi:type III secretory pathway component EscV
MDSLLFPFPFLLWIALAAIFGAALTYFFTQQRLAELENDYEQLQMEADERDDDANRKIRESSQQVSVMSRKLEEVQQELLLYKLNTEKEKQGLVNEIKQLNIQLDASENEMEVMRVYWARKEQEWQVVQEGLNMLLSEKDHIIADLHASLARLAAGQAQQSLQRKEEKAAAGASADDIHSSLL